jgi:hypothetical protein
MKELVRNFLLAILQMPRRLWRCLSEGSGLPKLWLQWLLAIILSCAPSYFIYSSLGWLPILVIWAAIFIICAVSILTRNAFSRRPTQGAESSTDLLISAIDLFCAQIESRKAQRPWVLASLVAYVSAFLLCIHTLAGETSGNPAVMLPPRWEIALAVTIAIGSMLTAGFFAEDNPPEDADDVLRTVLQYCPMCPEQHAMLVSRIQEGIWKMEDLVEFTAIEEKEARRRSLIRRQRAIYQS